MPGFQISAARIFDQECPLRGEPSEVKQRASNQCRLLGKICFVFCLFCSLDPTRIWIEQEHALAVPDAYPVTDGHTLVIPRKHVASIYELSADQQQAVWQMVSEVRSRLLTGMKPDGFNIGVNDGLAAGQTVLHAHIHIIPRRAGDVPDPRGGIRWIIDDKANY